MRRLAGGLVAAAMLVAGCGDDDASGGGDGDDVTLELWVNWEGPDFDALRAVVDRYEDEHPGITVEMTPAAYDTPKLIAAIQGGTAPDAVATYDQSSIGKLCSTGAWVDLADHIEADDVDPAEFAPAVRDAGTFEGTTCALPYIGDTFGLYYNKALFAEAGITAPPTTFSELADAAKKLTKLNPDGSIAVAGFVPIVNYYEQYIVRYGPVTGGQYFDDQGKSVFGEDPGWKGFFEWQRQLIDDLGGYEELTKFTATAGEEFSPENPFQTGKIAMVMDGEWRTRFIEEEAPDLDYGTAAFPVLDGHPDLLGASIVGPEVLGIPKGSDHEDEAWDLIHWLATDTAGMVEFVNAIHNVPSTEEALASSDLDLGDHFGVFLEAFRHPGSGQPPLIEEGTAYFDPITAFAEKWQAGEVDDLDAGMEGVDEEVDAVIARG